MRHTRFACTKSLCLLVHAIMQKQTTEIKLLLEKGVKIDDFGPNGESVLCLAFKYFTSMDIIQLLLDAGSLPSRCHLHDHELYCALDCPSVGSLDEDLFGLLIARVADLNAVASKGLETYGQSLLCFALKKGVQASVIKTLLEAGCEIHCRRHTYPWLCVASGNGQMRRLFEFPELKADIVQLLLSRCKCMNYMVLKEVLIYCKYETKVIELLFDSLKDENFKAFEDRSQNTLLHMALLNPHVKPNVVKLLIKQGVPVEKVNMHGNTALHVVARLPCMIIRKSLTELYENQLCSVVKTLLESGARVNVLNSSNKNPIELAIKVLKEYESRKYLNAFCDLEKGLECWKVLLKHYLIEISDSVFQIWIQGSEKQEELLRFGEDSVCEPLMRFGDDWVCELNKLDSDIVGQDRTLQEYLAGFQGDACNCETEAESIAFHQLLRIMHENDFPLFIDVMAALVPKSSMKIKLQELEVYIITRYLGKSCMAAEKVLLNYVPICKIAEYLTKQDLLKFILAFYKTDDRACTVSKKQRRRKRKKSNNVLENTRTGIQSEQCRKHSKFHT